MRISKNIITKVTTVVSILCIILFIVSCATFQSQQKAKNNKELVVTFANEFFNEHKMEAAEKYVVPSYIQHNPMAATGRAAMMEFFQGFWKNFPDASSDIKRVVAEGDLVVLHYHFKMKKDDRGFAVVDIFRLENGKIVEHWDVMQQIPEKSANQNTMF